MIKKRRYRIVSDSDNGWRVEYKEPHWFADWLTASATMNPGKVGYNSFRNLDDAKAFAARHALAGIHSIIDLGYLPE